MLVAAFLLSAVTGIKLHVLYSSWGHSEGMLAWIDVHIYASLAFVLLTLLHTWQHLAWYKFLFKKTKKINLILRRAGVVLFDMSFLALSFTGIWLWLQPASGLNSLFRLHYVIGLASIFFALCHIIRRIKAFI